MLCSTRLLITLSICPFFFNDTATTEIYPYWPTLSLHDALPIAGRLRGDPRVRPGDPRSRAGRPPRRYDPRLPVDLANPQRPVRGRSEEHTSELQSLMRISYAVFCLKKTIQT